MQTAMRTAMRSGTIIGLGSAVAAVALWACARWLGLGSIAFAWFIVWIPMVVLGSVSHFVTIRLPAPWHALRAWERDGSLYERLGVRIAKRLLRRGPFAKFNPRLHLPRTLDDAAIARLEAHMCEAEASHAILLLATLGVAMHAAVRGWWWAAAATFVFDLLMNGYPVMLQRYNRALLHRRFRPLAPAPTSRDNTAS
jgi:hypothetical protein